MASTSGTAPAEPLKMSPQAAEVFKSAVKYILTEWPALNLAIDNGMGGPQAKEIREWMCQTVTTTMLKKGDFDLDSFISSIVFDEFDTVIEDGSLEYNIKWIEKYYKDCLQGKEIEVQEALNHAAMKKISLGNVPIPKPVEMKQDSTDDEDEDEQSDSSDT